MDGDDYAVHNCVGVVKKIMEYMTNIDERIQCTEGLVFSGLGQTSPMVLAGPDRARQIQIVPRQFWTHFCMFWHAFDVFFRTYFSTWFRDRSNEILMKSDEIFMKSNEI